MSDLSECCYGMGFGPEGDGVELYKAGDTLTLDTLTGTIKHHSSADLKPGKAVDATMRWVSPKRDDDMARHPAYQQGVEIGRAIRRSMERDRGSFENIQWPQFTFETKESRDLAAARERVAKAGGPSLDELRKRLGGWDVPEVSGTLKPALPALTRQAGEKYKGLGFCDGCE